MNITIENLNITLPDTLSSESFAGESRKLCAALSDGEIETIIELTKKVFPGVPDKIIKAAAEEALKENEEAA